MDGVIAIIAVSIGFGVAIIIEVFRERVVPVSDRTIGVFGTIGIVTVEETIASVVGTVGALAVDIALNFF